MDCDLCKHISIIGAGTMGSAIVSGLIESNYNPSLITIANPHQDNLKQLIPLGVNVTTDNVDAIKGADLIRIAVKPCILPLVLSQLKNNIDYHKQEITIVVAGVSGNDISSMLVKDDKVALPILSIAMPNTAMRVRKSMTFIVQVNGQAYTAIPVFEMLGKTMIIEERLLPAATALASCGIAYAMRYVRAACAGGVELGFKASQAQEIVAETIDGAAYLLSLPGAHPESEIDKVTTPGGLTIKGLNAMEAAGFTNAVIAGLKAGR